MDIIIRKALPEDAYDYAMCGISCWQSAYKGIVPDEYLDNMPTGIEQRIEDFRESFANPGDIQSYCVMYADKMIGFLVIDIANANIWAIYLIEDFWGKGYGKNILDFAVNELKYIGHKKIYLWVLEENNRARRFYEKHGFIFDGETREKTYGKPLVQFQYVFNFVE